MASRVSSAIDAWRLETRFLPNGEKLHQQNTFTNEVWRPGARLGNGTYGDVWHETCVSGQPLNAVRAVKHIAKRHWKLSERELEALVMFSDRGIPEYRAYFVQCLGWFDDPNTLYIAMEYVPHGDLQKHIFRKPCSEPETASIIVQVSQALRFMHSNGFVHRDLKPLNILVAQSAPQWHVKVADFGICKRTDGTDLRTHQVGTQGYMAPEVFDDIPGSYTAAVDMWSLGAVAFCVRTGNPPFRTLKHFFDYCHGVIQFPIQPLASSSALCVSFIRDAMEMLPDRRLTIDQALSHHWLNASYENSIQSSRPLSTHHTQSLYLEHSNAWSNTYGNTAMQQPKFGPSLAPATPNSRQSPLTARLNHFGNGPALAHTSNEMTVRVTRNEPVPHYNQMAIPAQVGQRLQGFVPTNTPPVTFPSSNAWSHTYGNSSAPTVTPNEIRSSARESRPPVNHPAYFSTPPMLGQSQNTSQSLLPSPALSTPLPSSRSASPLKLKARLSRLFNKLVSEPAAEYPRTLSPITQTTNSGNASVQHSTNIKPIDDQQWKGSDPSRRIISQLAQTSTKSGHSTHSNRPTEQHFDNGYCSASALPPPMTGHLERLGAASLHEVDTSTKQHRRQQIDSGYQTPSPTDAVVRSGHEERLGAASSYEIDTSTYQHRRQQSGLGYQTPSPTEAIVESERDFGHHTRTQVNSGDDSPPSTVASIDDALQHAEGSTPHLDPSCTCLTCGLQFNSRNRLFTHLDYEPDHAVNSITHPDPSCTCLTCGTQFSSRNRLFTHLDYLPNHAVNSATHLDPSCTCLSCGIGFSSRNGLFAHLDSQPDHAVNSTTHLDPSYTCLSCGTQFSSRNRLFTHLDYLPNHAVNPTTHQPETYEHSPGHSPEKGWENDSDSDSGNRSEYVDPHFTCLSCHSEFSDRSDLFDHLESYGHARDLDTFQPESYRRPRTSRMRD